MEIEIPILPRGKTVQLYILSTWGDKNYVGLNGIEFWNREGKVTTVNINKRLKFFSTWNLKKLVLMTLWNLLSIQGRISIILSMVKTQQKTICTVGSVKLQKKERQSWFLVFHRWKLL